MVDNRYGNRDRSSSIFSDEDDDRGERWRSNQANRGGQPMQQQGDDRGFFSKAGDEVRSWFGDEDAEHRREEDARRWEREHGESGRYQGGGHEDQWRGGAVNEDRGYAEAGSQARQFEGGRFRGGYDRDDQGAGGNRAGYGQDDQRGYGQRGGQGAGQSGHGYGQGGSHQSGQARQPYGAQSGKYGPGQYGQSSFGEGNRGHTGYGAGQGGQFGQGGSGGSDYGQSGRYGQVGQASYGQRSHQDQSGGQFGHYGSEQDYGRAGQTQGGAQRQSEQSGRFGGSPHDESYRRWRDQQLETLDEEYDEYCRHRQSQFEHDFHSFRQTRGQQLGQQPGQQGGQSGQSGQGQLSAGQAGGSGPGQQNAGASTAAAGSASATTASTGSSAGPVGDENVAENGSGKTAKSR